MNQKHSNPKIQKYVNKGNKSITLFKSHKSIERKNKYGLQFETEVKTSTIRGTQRNNRNTEVQQKTKRIMQQTQRL